jgi:hypothetical protein
MLLLFVVFGLYCVWVAKAPEEAVRFGLVAMWVALAGGCAVSVVSAVMR